MPRSFRGLLNRTVVLTRTSMTGETGGGQPINEAVDVGLLRARIEPTGLGGRSLPTTELQVRGTSNPTLEAIVADFHAVTELDLEPDPEDPDAPRVPAALTERDVLVDTDGVYEILSVGTADGRSRPHHYEAKLRKITP